MLTMEVYAKELPPGVVNFISGSGRKTMPHVMRSGSVDVLAFIGDPPPIHSLTLPSHMESVILRQLHLVASRGVSGPTSMKRAPSPFLSTLAGR